MFDAGSVSWQDIGEGALLMVCIALATIAVISFILHYFVALNATPGRRALWTVAISYVVAALALIFGDGDPYMQLRGPVAAIPAAILVFAWWRSAFKRAWVGDASQLPEGAKLANTDWRVGLAFIASMIAIAIAKRLIRGF